MDPRDAKFPENFPVHGNSVPETGSRESAHTAKDLGDQSLRLGTPVGQVALSVRPECGSRTDNRDPHTGARQIKRSRPMPPRNLEDASLAQAPFKLRTAPFLPFSPGRLEGYPEIAGDYKWT